MTDIDVSSRPLHLPAPRPAARASRADRPQDLTLPELFARQAAARPCAPAVRHRDRTLSYGQLDAGSTALAARLLAAGITPGEPVGVCGSRSPEALIALVGILKAGCAYVPLDDDLPPARLRAMAEDAGLRAAVTLPGTERRVRGLRVSIPAVDDGDSAPAPVRTTGVLSAPGDCAYVAFTSGTTGRPKPVAIPHRGVARLVLADRELPPPGPGDRILHGYGLSSDASTIEIWGALLTGACLVIADREELLSPTALEHLLRSRGVTVAYLTTSVFHLLARTRPQSMAGLRFVSAGGEAMDPRLANAVLAACPGTTVVNFYGPTENSVVSTAHVVRPLPEDADGVPIGRPYAGTTCHVLRADGTPAAPGEEGELYVGGEGLALGYPGDEQLTAERFVRLPQVEPGGRLYRTGDRVVRTADGLLEYRGRADRQVKLRGARIELDEVEARLRAHPSVAEAVVETDGEALTAYLTPTAPAEPLPLPELRGYCARWLPPQAVPVLVALDRFPVTSGGKVDRKRLRATAAATAATSATAAASATASTVTADRIPHQQPAEGLAGLLAGIWQQVLRTRPAPEDDFFHLGGDSLLASEAVTRTLAALGLDAALSSTLIRALLTAPTLARFTEAVRAARDGSPSEAGQSTVDFVREAELDFRLPPAQGPAPRPRDPAHVLLTGASGFVGAFLLTTLLRRTTARIHCPVRAASPGHAEQRVRTALARYGLHLDETDRQRLECFPADLAEPGLGLSAERRAELAARLDLIVHNGAQVNFLYPYEQLRAPNVDGTREIVRLAAPRRVPVHFLSTVAVVAGAGAAGVREVTEDAPLAHADGLTMGYAESKWVAEGVLRRAAEQGLPVAVHRPYEVTGDQVSGVSNTETAICSLFRTIAETGLAPDIALPMDFVPVDHLAEAVVHIATRRDADGRTYHLTNPRPAMLSDVIDRMRAAGCAVRTLPYPQWVDELVRHVAANPTSATAPFVSLCVDRSRTADMSVKELYFEGTFPVLGRHNAEAALADSGLHCPPVDSALLDRYLEYFFASGYLQRPTAGSATATGSATGPAATGPAAAVTAAVREGTR
ncbi:amino acid adenylation domain-containing protein [Kitasatospora sp. NPDC098652]|uniref:amino acid adenylation domain-containing protein n=1 Tax=Kitasatospora sp. NPDC098652 TaxID=3364095 RepID=UPI0037F564B8